MVTRRMVVVAFAVPLLALCAGAQEPATKIDVTPEMLASRDYSILLKLTGGKGELPTAEEQTALGALWPTAPLGELALFYLTWVGDRVTGADWPPGSPYSEMDYPGDPAALRTWIDSQRGHLDLLRRGLKAADRRLPLLFQRLEAMPSRRPRLILAPPLAAITASKHAAALMMDNAFLMEVEGRQDDAAGCLLEAFGIGHTLRNTGHQYTFVVGCSTQGMLMAQLRRLIANSELSRETLWQIIASCRHAEVNPSDIIAMWDRKAAMQRVLYARLTTEAEWRAFWTVPPWPGAPRAILKPPPREAFMTMLPDVQDKVRDALNRPLAELISGDPDFRARMEALARTSDVAAPYFLRMGHGMQWDGYSQTDFRALQIRAAIALYARQHGTPPKQLEDLVPTYLPAVPMDPFSGKPLRYGRGEKRWKVWSVGEDRKDDGGANSRPSAQWSGLDAVYWSELLSNIQARKGYYIQISRDGDFVTRHFDRTRRTGTGTGELVFEEQAPQ